MYLYNTDFYGKVELTTAPGAEPTHWYQTLFIVGEPHEVEAGDVVAGTVDMFPGEVGAVQA